MEIQIGNFIVSVVGSFAVGILYGSYVTKNHYQKLNEGKRKR